VTSLSTTLRKHLNERRDESRESIRRAERIETMLAAKLDELYRDTTRRDACLALGDKHGEVEWKAEIKSLGPVVDMSR
jgi:transcriptional regulator of acetoin/glycerol metabolism